MSIQMNKTKTFTKVCANCGITLIYEYHETDKDIGIKRLPYYRCWQCLDKIVMED